MNSNFIFFILFTVVASGGQAFQQHQHTSSSSQQSSIRRFKSIIAATSSKTTTTTTTSEYTNTKSNSNNMPYKIDETKLTPSGADLNAWAKGFSTCPQELPPTIFDLPLLPPDFPGGTYYRNGHARFEADDGTKVLHPFDGDGMIVAMTFDPEQKRMLFRNKFIQTEGYMEDKRTGKMSARGLFGTMRSGGILANAFRTRHKNVANTNVVHCGDTLYALWEGGLPYALDPLTLENKFGPGIQSETDLDGLTVTDNFAAHLRYDPKTKTYVNFAVKFDPNAGYSTITLFELDQETFRSCKPSSPSIVSEGPGLIHDFILTDNYCIFNINKCKLDGKNGLKALLGLSGFAGAIDIDANVKETSIVLVPRYLFEETKGVEGIDYLSDDRIIVCKVPNHFNFHFGNAYEDEHGHVVFDTVQTTEISLDGMSEMSAGVPVWDLPNPFALVTPNTLVRYTLDVENRCMAKEYPPKTLSTRIPEFPSLPKEMSTRKHRYLYPVASHLDVSNRLDVRAKGSGPAGAIQKVDTLDPDMTETFAFEPYEFPGEVVFAPKVGRDVSQHGQEDAGYLLVHVVNGKDKTTDFLIFDVEGRKSLEKGPILRQRLPTFLPHMLHGNFFEGVTFDFEAAMGVPLP